MEPKMFNVTMTEEAVCLILEGLGELPHKRVDELVNVIRKMLLEPPPNEAKPQIAPPDLPAIVPDAKGKAS